MAGLQKSFAEKSRATCQPAQKLTDPSQTMLTLFTLWLANRQGKINEQEQANEKLEKERNKYQAQANNLKEKLKQSQREQASSTAQLATQEKEIVQRINTDCQLGLEDVNL